MLVVILGPTGIGKTNLAVHMAEEFHTEILSADSRQFYRQLQIGVARPSLEELRRVKHHLVGFLDVAAPYNAGIFEHDALGILENIFGSHDIALCVGGSMLYIDALLDGLDDLPSDLAVRKKLKAELEEKGKAWLLSELHRLDPDYLQRVDQHNMHRVLRAVEVCLCSGTTYTSLRSNKNARRPFRVLKIGLEADRHWINQRINARVDSMMHDGLEDECRGLLPARHLQSLNTVGYKEMFDFFDGTLSKDEAIDKIKQHTRQFAKRQMTWWKRDPGIHWIRVDTEKNVLKMCLDLIRDTQAS